MLRAGSCAWVLIDSEQNRAVDRLSSAMGLALRMTVSPVNIRIKVGLWLAFFWFVVVLEQASCQGFSSF
jgi:hypothetical protein